MKKTRAVPLLLVALVALGLTACTTTPPLGPDPSGNLCQYPRNAQTIAMAWDITTIDQNWQGWALQAANRWNNVQSQTHAPWFDGINARSHSENNVVGISASARVADPGNPIILGQTTWGACPFRVVHVWMNTWAVGAGDVGEVLYVFTHEFGHVLGLNHNPFNNNIFAHIDQSQCGFVAVMHWSDDGYRDCGVDHPNGLDINPLSGLYD